MKQMIRAAAVAKHIGIPSSELRKVLSEVNFGIEPTAREFQVSLAQGLIRYMSRRLNKEIPPLESADEKGSDEESEVSEEGQEEAGLSSAQSLASVVREQRKKQEAENPPPPPAPEEQPAPAPVKQNLGSAQTLQNLGRQSKATGLKASAAAVFRKIEIDPEEAALAKEKHEEEKRNKEELERQRREEAKMLQHRRKQAQILVKKEGPVSIPEMISIKEFSEKVGIPVSEILQTLLKNGMVANLTQTLDFDTYALIADELEIELVKELAQASAEDLAGGDLELLLEDEAEKLQERPPVIVIIGHVDHGKTSILDAIRETKVVEGEHGGITQHIGAYQVEKSGRVLTFLDTPGHEAFTSMRARGAQTADIAILVVAADEGLKPQTIEAIRHAKEAKVPIIVALNKMDKPDANPDKVKSELAEQEVLAEDWGGDVPVVPLSALKREGIGDLLDIIILQADILELKANPDRLAVGSVIEAHLDSSLGPIATVLVNTGTLQVGDDFLIREHVGRVKSLTDDTGKKLKKVGPSAAIVVAGLSAVPSAGDILQSFPSKKVAQKKAQELSDILAREGKRGGGGLSELMASLHEGKMELLKIVLKADTEGSLEAVRQAIEKLGGTQVKPKIIHAAVGAVSESDVMMASAAHGTVLSFHADITPRIRRIAEGEGVDLREFQIIYELIEHIDAVLKGLLKPEEREVNLGEMLVKKIFYSKKKLMIVGCGITQGKVEQGASIRVFRGDAEEPLGVTRIASLQHYEKKVTTLEAPEECGIQIEGKIEPQEGDRLVCYRIEEYLATDAASKE